ncbi:peptidoglycan DD-metalloendopeptidase family protein [Streptomyces cinereoruber]|uniref:peptidoglycan DD-metalloendopeptidase family protein n=1 Tax=Streptomyces cinereoruber TaxID=67260 RepID=UPI003C2C9ADE
MATAAVEVGVGYVSVVPSARGFADELQRQIGRPTVEVGAQVGEESGQAASRGMLSALGSGLKAGLAAVAVAGAAVFTAAFVQAVEQDKSNARLAAQLGLSPKDAKRLGKIAGDVYAKGYGESIDQINDSLRTLAQNGVIAVSAPKKDIEALTKSATNLAEAFGVDVGDAARAAGQLIRTGMVKDAREAFDLITVGFQSGADKGGDFIDTLNEYGTQFRKAGLDGAAAVGLITQALQAGARDGDIAADAIKEFSIRAVDGSESSAEGFKALGLNAVTMGQMFARGGTTANQVLDTTLDRLRSVKDPVKQSQIAVALFGTQAEDLGQALFAMDPSSAVGALGKVGGAADRMGAALHDTATNDFEVFKRQAMQSIVAVIDREVLPVIAKIGNLLLTEVPPALTAVSDAFAAGVNWVREYGAWLLPLGVAVAGLTITMNASAIATGAVTAVFSLYRGVILAATAVTRGYAIVQGFLNAVMTANPIGLIITGIAALVTLLVVAYKKSDTFRAIVQATWAGIRAGWDWLWTNALKPGFEGLMTGLRAIGTAAMWLWNNAIKPAFDGIALAGKIAFAILATIVIAPLVILFRALGAVAFWLWDNAFKPVFDAIGAGSTLLWERGVKPAFDQVMLILRAIGATATWLWNNAVLPAFDGIVAAGKAVGAGFNWLWSSVVRPVLTAIGAIAGWLWTNAIKPVFDNIVLIVRTAGLGFDWLWTNAVKPSLGWIADKATWLYDKAIRPAFDKVKEAARLLGVAFDLAQKGIGKAWDRIKENAKGPVNFVIEWVYTKGIKATWDKVASFVGLDPLPAAPKLLAAGGTVGPGWGPAAPMKVNRPTAIVGEGNPRHPEYVIPTDPRYRGRALSLWEAAGSQLMADGGIIGGAVDWLGGAARKVGGAVMSGVDFLSDPGAMWEKATAFIRDKVREIGSSSWAQMLARVPGKMLSGLKDKIVKAAASFFGGDDAGGGAWARPVSAALGTRYAVRGSMWSSGYHTGTDFPAPTGTAVRAAANGIVQSALSGGPYGNHITLNHGGGLTSLYAHLSSMAVRPGQRVPQGMRIGAVGATGNTTGPHLHFEARRGGRTINPEPFLGYAGGGRPKPHEVFWVGERGPELMQAGSGGARVWDSRTSMRMAAGVAMDATASKVAAAAARAASTAVAPAGAGAQAGAAGGGLQAGDRLALRIDGHEFTAVVETIADGRVAAYDQAQAMRATAGRR